MLIDAGYGNNTSFLQELENRQLKYIGGIAKNRKVIIPKNADEIEEIREDNLAKDLPRKAFSKNQLQGEKTKTVWVAKSEIEVSKLTGKKVIAIAFGTALTRNRHECSYLRRSQ